MLAPNNSGETPLLALFRVTPAKMIPNTPVGQKVPRLRSSGRKSMSQEGAHLPAPAGCSERTDDAGEAPFPVPLVSPPLPPPTPPSLLKTGC